MADYIDYLKNEGMSKGNKQLQESMQFTNQLLQNIKNKNAPAVSGGGGSVSGGGRAGSSSYSGSMAGIPAMAGKVNPVSGRLTQSWGGHKPHYAAGRHTGIDYGVPVGSRVGAAASGIVTKVGWEGAYGNAIHVRHADGTTTLYAHLSGVSVKAGQRVGSGQQIGRSGNTGNSSGPHLHFEVRRSDRYGGDINPASWFSTR